MRIRRSPSTFSNVTFKNFLFALITNSDVSKIFVVELNWFENQNSTVDEMARNTLKKGREL